MGNDLIRKFSSHALHEPFSLSAHGFFEINLNLIGSVMKWTVNVIRFQLSLVFEFSFQMIAASVTYLVVEYGIS